MAALKEIAKFYKCFCSPDKLRILNLLFELDFVITSDVVKILSINNNRLVKKSSINNYLNEFYNTGYISYTHFSKFKLYQIRDNYRKFIKTIVSEIDDPIVKNDIRITRELKKNGLLFYSKVIDRCAEIQKVIKWHNSQMSRGHLTYEERMKESARFQMRGLRGDRIHRSKK